MQAGELIVSGKNDAHIHLRGLPREVKCYFKLTQHVAVPCNPCQDDWLEYEVHSTNTGHSGFVLVIKWDVSSVREIVWHVSY